MSQRQRRIDRMWIALDCPVRSPESLARHLRRFIRYLPKDPRAMRAKHHVMGVLGAHLAADPEGPMPKAWTRALRA